MERGGHRAHVGSVGKTPLVVGWLALVACGARTPLDSPPLTVTSNDEPCVNDAGASLVTLASNLDAPSAIALAGDGVYWLTGNNTSHDGTLQRCGRCGCRDAPATLATGLDWNDTPDAYPMPALATDGANVYFDGADRVYACALSGCAGEPAIVASKQSVGGIAAADGLVYWTNFDVIPSTIASAPPSGAQPPATLLSLDGGYLFEDVRVHDGTMFFVSFEGVMTCPTSGCADATLFAKGSPATGGLALDDVNVYWANRYAASTGGAATVESCPLAGCQGAPTVIATGLADDHFRAIATDGVNVYWTDFAEGTISKCPVTGCAGAPTLLASGQLGPEQIAVDETSVYWTTAGTPNFDHRDGTVMKLTPK